MLFCEASLQDKNRPIEDTIKDHVQDDVFYEGSYKDKHGWKKTKKQEQR